MTTINLRTFTPADKPAVMELQNAYARLYPAARVIPAEVYLSPAFRGGERVACAFDPAERLLGYAPFLAGPVPLEASLTHKLWVEIRVDPRLDDPTPVREALFGQLRTWAAENPGAALTFQYDPSETASIAYALDQGGCYAGSVFLMQRDLTMEIPFLAPPAQVTVRPWALESEDEQRRYVEARSESFPEAPIDLAEWQYFQRSQVWAAGGSLITAFHEDELVGSVTAFWDPEEMRRLERKVGHTEYVFVREGWRELGIASYLLAQALKYLKEQGLEEALLEVRAENQVALGRYESLGYQVERESRLYALDVTP